MAITASSDLNGLGHYKVRVLRITSLTTARQALKVGSFVFRVIGAVNLSDTTAVRVEKNTDADGNTANGSVAVSNADAGADTVEVTVAVID